MFGSATEWSLLRPTTDRPARSTRIALACCSRLPSCRARWFSRFTTATAKRGTMCHRPARSSSARVSAPSVCTASHYLGKSSRSRSLRSSSPLHSGMRDPHGNPYAAFRCLPPNGSARTAIPLRVAAYRLPSGRQCVRWCACHQDPARLGSTSRSIFHQCSSHRLVALGVERRVVQCPTTCPNKFSSGLHVEAAEGNAPCPCSTRSPRTPLAAPCSTRPPRSLPAAQEVMHSMYLEMEDLVDTLLEDPAAAFAEAFR